MTENEPENGGSQGTGEPDNTRHTWPQPSTVSAMTLPRTVGRVEEQLECLEKTRLVLAVSTWGIHSNERGNSRTEGLAKKKGQAFSLAFDGGNFSGWMD